jgi:uncharacterized damage-inducible protein DinB
MNREDLLLLLDYNYWATDRVLGAARRASEEELHARSPSSGQSIHATLVHIASAEQIWRLRCQGDSPTRLLVPEDCPTLPEFLEVWEAEQRAMRDFAAGITDEELAATIHYQNTKGAPFEQKLWQILAHVINHGTQHRAEAAYLLTELGYSPGDVDLIVFLRLQ